MKNLYWDFRCRISEIIYQIEAYFIEWPDPNWNVFNWASNKYVELDPENFPPIDAFARGIYDQEEFTDILIAEGVM